jgi:hypothetical protein
MFISKVALPRRTFLRGVGATLALPLLDSMVPAMTAAAQTAANPARRFGCVYIPHGCIMDQWTPTTEGAGFELPSILRPLEAFQDSMVVVSNLKRPELEGIDTNHAGAPSSWLTGVWPKRTAGPDYALGITIDQTVARQIGRDTTIPSIEIATEDFTGLIGDCSPGFSCAYMNTLSWQDATTPLPMEINPRVVFDRMFGGGGTREERLARMRTDRSILDFVVEDIGGLRAGLGPRDTARLEQYLDHVREIERRIQLAEQQSQTLITVPDAPVGVPESFEEHVGLLFELMALAFEVDMSRVFTFMMARELSQRTYPNLEVTEPHHSISHHANKPETIAGHARVNTYHVGLFGKFLQRLRDTPDGDGTLLDHSLFLYGSGMGNGNVHEADHLPTLLVGGSGGRILGHRHIVAPPSTPNANLLLSLAEHFDAPVDSFGVSSSRIDL